MGSEKNHAAGSDKTGDNLPREQKKCPIAPIQKQADVWVSQTDPDGDQSRRYPYHGIENKEYAHGIRGRARLEYGAVSFPYRRDFRYLNPNNASVMKINVFTGPMYV